MAIWDICPDASLRHIEALAGRHNGILIDESSKNAGRSAQWRLVLRILAIVKLLAGLRLLVLTRPYA
jgi:hypothetical protein